MTKPIVLIAEELSPATVEALGPDFEIRYCDGADRAELLPGHRRRRRDPDPLGHQGRRRGARCGAPAQGGRPRRRRPGQRRRQRGDPGRGHGRQRARPPTSARPPSSPSPCCWPARATSRRPTQPSRAGEWKRSKYTGVELADKVVGVVGLGRIGMLVAQRLSAFGVTLIAYDPFVQPARAAQMGIRMVSLDELLADSDFITVHLPKTPETIGLIGDEALHKVKPTVRIINAARGGIVDEAALYDAHRRRPGRRGRHRRVRQGAVHGLAAVHPRAGRRHPAPGRLHRRGAGEGRHRRGQVGAPGPGRRAGPRRRERQGWGHRRRRPPDAAADRGPGPDRHRAGRVRPSRPSRPRSAARSPRTT